MKPLPSTGTLSPWEPGILSLAIYGLLVLILVAVSPFSFELARGEESESGKVKTL